MSNPEVEEKRAQLRAARIEEMRQSAERLKNDQDRMRQLVGNANKQPIPVDGCASTEGQNPPARQGQELLANTQSIPQKIEESLARMETSPENHSENATAQTMDGRPIMNQKQFADYLKTKISVLELRGRMDIEGIKCVLDCLIDLGQPQVPETPEAREELAMKIMKMLDEKETSSAKSSS